MIALASVEIDVDGIVFMIDGVRIFKYGMSGNVQDFAGVGASQFRDENGEWRPTVQLPSEIEAAFSAAMVRRRNKLGITDVKRTLANSVKASRQRSGSRNDGDT